MSQPTFVIHVPESYTGELPPSSGALPGFPGLTVIAGSRANEIARLEMIEAVVGDSLAPDEALERIREIIEYVDVQS